ncbi:protein S-acyltransferase 10 [Dorcoceras hygrometricum]|uniref:Protein S-acyltransferase 10 n=1 Tax=Dorcoceras hygrometricum TaxID=472368 RepID=A0A2Z7DJC8_9LAMI|nr:protein S-acyltransferase 10 [Dorcoceras hygrometricum]
MGALCGGSLRDTWTRSSDRCYRLIPCLSDPVRRSALSLKLALVGLHLIFVGVLFLLDHDLIEKTKQEPWYTSIYVLLFIATLAQYFITSGTSPGYVLDAQKIVNERDAIARRTSLASKPPASSKIGNVVITVDGRNYQRGNETAWTKLVMDLYPPGSSVRYSASLFLYTIIVIRNS